METDTKRRVRKPSPAQIRAAVAVLRENQSDDTDALLYEALTAVADWLEHEAGKGR